MADRVAIRGLRGHGHHGVAATERSAGQPFVVDAVVTLDTRRAALGDDLAQTVDYGVLARELRGVVEGEPVALLETLAARLAETCLRHPQVESVEITVHKPHAPLDADVDDVAVTIVRHRL